MNGEVMVYIVYDRAIDEEVLDLLEGMDISYYTKWRDVLGVGRHDPHLGDDVWPGLNNIIMVVIQEEKKIILLDSVKSLQTSFPSVGLRAFVVPVVDMV
jgi:hypothetical protein